MSDHDRPPDRYDRAGLPRLVIFDVDGTLQDTLAWWPDVLVAGVAELSRKLGIELPPPDLETARRVVGRSDAELWAPLLPPARRDQWPHLRDVLVPLEIATLTTGRSWLFPGTVDLLEDLRRAGVRIALASNCRRRYFDAVLEGQGLASLVDDALCLDSEGVETKRDMVGIALDRAGTRDAVMVGDREIDLDAATWHRLPFVLRCGFHAAGDLPAETEVDSQAELGRALRGRVRFLRELEERLAGASRIGITGPPGVGKTLLARQLGRLQGRPVLGLDAYARKPEEPPTDPDPLGRAFEVAAFRAALEKEPEVLAEGPFLEDPRLRPGLDAVVHLVAGRRALERRSVGRNGGPGPAGSRFDGFETWLEFPPHRKPDPRRIVVCMDRVLFPRFLEVADGVPPNPTYLRENGCGDLDGSEIPPG